MDLYKLKTFKTVAAFLNFNQAAQYLNLAQSTVSNQIKSLEEEIGTLLFRRSGKTIHLTSAGEKMVAHAGRLLNMEKEAIADITGEKPAVERLSLRGPEAFIDTYFPTLIKKLLARHPRVELDISNCLESNIENELHIENVDLAFIFSDYISCPSLITEKIIDETLVLATFSSHPLAGKNKVEAADFQKETLFFLKTGCGYGLPFRQLLNSDSVNHASIIEMTSVEAIKKCVGQGLGITILPRSSIQKELEADELAALNWPKELKTPVLMVRHRDRRISRVLGDFMALVREICISTVFTVVHG